VTALAVAPVLRRPHATPAGFHDPFMKGRGVRVALVGLLAAVTVAGGFAGHRGGLQLGFNTATVPSTPGVGVVGG
jgi:hypothetical protein